MASHKRRACGPQSPAADRIGRAGASRLFLGLIWSFCLLLVAGIWWFVYQQTQFEHRQAIEDATRQNANRAIAFEQYVRRTIEGADLVTRYVGGRFARGEPGAERAGRPGRPSRISGTAARGATFLSVTVIDPDGIRRDHVDRPACLQRRRSPRFPRPSRPGGRWPLQSSAVFVRSPGKMDLASRRLNRPTAASPRDRDHILPTFTAFYRDARVGPGDV